MNSRFIVTAQFTTSSFQTGKQERSFNKMGINLQYGVFQVGHTRVKCVGPKVRDIVVVGQD